MSIEVRYKLWPGGIEPKRYSKWAACFDLALPDDVVVPPNGIETVDLKIGFEPKDTHHYMLMYPRSSVLVKYGILMPTSVIDTDYRGSVHAILYSTRPYEVMLKAGTRVAQVSMMAEVETKFERVCVLTPTARGEGGMGSTGV
jgi:dUTP pyrophosphatase